MLSIRHSKTYRNFAAAYARLQQERIAVSPEFVADVEDGVYPAAEHIVSIDDHEFNAFLAQVK
ncbi:MAG: hypothetical protein KDE19_11650 [Caldilineaceae bacterium]|nr:hypothetical protein [Caldilineaceae bacterium]